MKVLITGATGTIGSEILKQCLQRENIHEIIAFARKNIPSTSPKFSCILMQDFKSWNEDILNKIKDADVMIWAMGTFNGSGEVDLQYPLTFQKLFLEAMTPRQGKPRFRYIHLSGALCEPDQEKMLLFMSAPRKVRGLAEKKSLEFAEENKEVWQTCVVRPGSVLVGNSVRNKVQESVLGKNWAIRGEELGAFVAELVVKGGIEESAVVVENLRMVERGREILKESKGAGGL
ncbi:hypothetical protein K469DRAFT_726121 [Zopfia rhizophila CBS 207.26]|uniref:NAD(P)-binding domain-containing protein n=1 Tax=Zopfia rhizophila CBS 207.26 TaxID=1314779 RepID=A0A6A6E8V7_9PEZI|nr:hypothetical protein K469DRAFT_726121 [Zopfia rhizophila CBS 207.26]